MPWNRTVLAAVAGGVAMWLLAGLWHSVLAAHFYTRETGATHEGTGIILVAYLVLAALMTWLHLRVRRGGPPWREGLVLGLVVGVLWVFPHELAMAGAHAEPLGYVFHNGAWHLVEQGFGGVVIALLIGRGPGAAPGSGPA